MRLLGQRTYQDIFLNVHYVFLLLNMNYQTICQKGWASQPPVEVEDRSFSTTSPALSINILMNGCRISVVAKIICLHFFDWIYSHICTELCFLFCMEMLTLCFSEFSAPPSYVHSMAGNTHSTLDCICLPLLGFLITAVHWISYRFRLYFPDC